MSMVTSSSVMSRRSFIHRRPLLSFFLLSFGLTWPFLIADALGSRGLITFRLPMAGPGLLLTLLMSYCPTIAALIVTGIVGGRAGIRRLLSRILRWRVGIGWYLFVIFGIGLLFIASQQIAVRLGAEPRSLPTAGPAMLAANILLGIVIGGIVNGEEFGWRGFALPRLQVRYSALIASLLLGVVWFLFHLPLFFTTGGGAGGNMSNTPLLAMALNVLAASVLVTWVFNNTRGSLLLVILFHASVNTWSSLFGSDSPGGIIFWVQSILLVALTLAVVVLYGPARLARITDENYRDLNEV